MWGCNYYDGAGFGHWFFGGGIIGFSISAFIIIIIAALIFKLFRSNQSMNSESLDKNDSFKILKTRFARGEINAQEYQRMKDVLRL